MARHAREVRSRIVQSTDRRTICRFARLTFGAHTNYRLDATLRVEHSTNQPRLGRSQRAESLATTFLSPTISALRGSGKRNFASIGGHGSREPGLTGSILASSSTPSESLRLGARIDVTTSAKRCLKIWRECSGERISLVS